MLALNKTLIAMSNNLKRSITNKSIVGFYDGAMPTKEDFQINWDTLKHASIPGRLNSLYIDNWLVSRGNTQVAQCLVDLSLAMRTSNLRDYVFPFAENTEELEVFQEGVAPTFCLMMTTDSASFNNLAENRYVIHLISCSVGDENSSAEMKILGGSFSSTNIFKLNDLLIEEF